jgi:hypothetical protein
MNHFPLQLILHEHRCVWNIITEKYSCLQLGTHSLHTMQHFIHHFDPTSHRLRLSNSAKRKYNFSCHSSSIYIQHWALNLSPTFCISDNRVCKALDLVSVKAATPSSTSLLGIRNHISDEDAFWAGSGKCEYTNVYEYIHNKCNESVLSVEKKY